VDRQSTVCGTVTGDSTLINLLMLSYFVFVETNNAVSLIHKPTGIRVQAHTHRSREANRNQARRVLAERVYFFPLHSSSGQEKEY
jgi:hypothetical protein